MAAILSAAAQVPLRRSHGTSRWNRRGGAVSRARQGDSCHGTCAACVGRRHPPFPNRRSKGFAVNRCLPTILTVLLAATACSDRTDPQSEDELEVVPFPSTHVLTNNDLELLQPENGNGKLTFETAPPSLASVAPGEVIVAGLSPSTPHGLMRVITKVDATGSGLALETLQAPVQLAFKKVHVKAHRSTRPIGTAANAAGTAAEDAGTLAPSLGMQSLGGSESTSTSVDVVVFDGDGDSTTTNDQVLVHGDLGGGFDYGFGFDVDWGAITDLPKAVKNCLVSLLSVA